MNRPVIVLVVDDEPKLGRFMELALKPRGFRVLSVTTPEEGLRVLQEQPIDVLVTDLVMPGMNGFDLLEEVRTHWPDLPIIVITAHATPNILRQVSGHHPFAYLTKPFSIEDLAQAVARAARSLAR